MKDNATWSGTQLIGELFYDWPKPHSEQFKLELCPPELAQYWVAINGNAYPLAVVQGQTCIANVQNLMALALSSHYNGIYVIWKPKTVTNAIWQRWVSKWAKRTQGNPVCV